MASKWFNNDMKFRSEIIWFPLAILTVIIILAWIRDNIIVSITVNEILRNMNIRNPERIKMLISLGIVIVAAILIIKVAGTKDDEN